ncbi:MAG TPA: FAD-binding oxidoreductase [Acidimicrobiales bacterium]|nr:FAD-binding oxidoreductase [Acidimicrobiales bacterium]
MPSLTAAIGRLRDVVGPRAVGDPEIVASYTTDWTGRFVGYSPLVVRPESTEEVADVVSACRELGLTLVPQGGNTGLVGGGVPLGGEVVLSLRRLRALDPVDVRSGQVTAGAGVALAQLQQTAAAADWSYGVDMASRGSATVGGMVATNAGGLHVLRYGDTRAQLVGLEAVLGTGAVVSHLGGLVKDNTGYDWPGLVCGSEGTLAVVTAARFRLVPPTPYRTAALLAFQTVPDALAAAWLLRRSLASLEACELFLASGVELVCSVSGIPAPFPRRHPAYLLVEVAGQTDPVDMLAEAADSLPKLADVAVATETARRAELWRFREDHTQAINSLGPPHKLDVALPLGALAEFVDRVPGVVASVDPGARTWLFGHVGDGNVHVNVTGSTPGDDRVDDVVLRLAAGLGGSISAEHGIGTAKKRWLSLSRTSAELSAFRSLKVALDPGGILNPNVLLPADPA